MRLYAFHLAPNPLKVITLTREKHLDVEIVYIGRSDYRRFCELNPLRKAPVLELDDGRVISESLTICQYLDGISGQPFLFGDSAHDRIEVAMWERRAEMELLNQAIEVYHHTHPMFRSNGKQAPDRALEALLHARRFLAVLEQRLGEVPFLAGNVFTAADITAYLGYFWLASMRVLPKGCAPVSEAWAERLARRDSLSILQEMALLLNVHTGELTEVE